MQCCWKRIVLITALLIPSLSGAAGPPAGPHPRFLLGNVGPALVAGYKARRPQITRLVQLCDGKQGQTIASGYQGFDWTEQMAACAVAWRATGNALEAAQAIVYWKALLDDRYAVGDHLGGVGDQGGIFIVCQDAGYSMRTFGTYGALGLDWLHDAPGVDAGLRAHAVARIDAWGAWYEQGDPRCVSEPGGGYQNNSPVANYFAGYFLATWAGAIAVGADDNVVGPRLWTRAASTLTDTLVKPALSTTLSGGDQVEGWEYGELTAASYFLASTAAAQNGYGAFAGAFVHDTIAFHLYALHPGNKAFHDNGDRMSHPSAPGTGALWAAIIAAPNDPYAPFARQYLNQVTSNNTAIWTQAVAEASGAWNAADWSQAGLPLSYLSKNTGAVLARSGWGPNDTWSSFQSGARDANDHQHCDAGHFEFIRGGDELAVTTSAYGTWATWNTNSMLFDDGGAQSTWPPQQGTWAAFNQVQITHFAELRTAAAAQGDFGHSYDNDKGSGSVTMARREWVFVRPDLLVINDRDTLAQPSVKATFALHTATAPTINGALLYADVGESRSTSQTLLPLGPARDLVNEPADNAGSAPWRNNDTWDAPLYRAEESATGASTQAFLHVLTAGPKGAQAVAATLTVTGGANVIVVPGNPARVIAVPANADGSDIALPFVYTVSGGASEHVLFGLAAANAYRVSAVPSGMNCAITVAAGNDPNVTSGDRGATFSLAGCGIEPAPDLARPPADLAQPADMAIPVAPPGDLAAPPGSDLVTVAVDDAAPADDEGEAADLWSLPVGADAAVGDARFTGDLAVRTHDLGAVGLEVTDVVGGCSCAVGQPQPTRAPAFALACAFVLALLRLRRRR